ncbi:hypothetical protein T492DRAFT_508159 [Pavlovales sp. CCMP2436]|nr:hypothetical protein T492DRAFT_508159 [Pavlovales sp. CCMP2436]
MVVGSIRINTTMRTAYHFQRVIKDDASLREVAVAERERMLQHEAEVELKLRTAEAAKAARGSLIRMVMHDLRSPLLSVANAVAIVQEVEPETRVDNPEVVESLRAMATCSQLMQNIVSDMLDFERIDSGRLVLVPAAMRVSQLLQAATDTFRGLAAAKGVTLRLVPLLFDLERAVFIGDVRRLQQCVNNGVSNSIKVRASRCTRQARRECSVFADAHGPPLALISLYSPLLRPHPSLIFQFTEAGGTVTIRARRGDDVQAQAKSKPDQPAAAATTTGWDTAAAAAAEAAAAAVPHASVVLEVDDSGVGLTADELHVLNQGEAFTQVGRGQLQGSGGSGLGLTIARDLLRLHGKAT